MWTKLYRILYNEDPVRTFLRFKNLELDLKKLMTTDNILICGGLTEKN